MCGPESLSRRCGLLAFQEGIGSGSRRIDEAMQSSDHYDILVIGSGPAGQKAAVQGAKAGKRVAVVERDRNVRGSCVHTGTIPSKTLRENALQLDRYQRSSTILECKLREDLRVDHLIGRMHQVVESHVSFMSSHLERNHI